MARKHKRALPAPTATQLGKWRDLAATAGRQAADPLAALGLGRIAQALSKTPLPLDHRRPDSPLYRLMRLGQGFEGFDRSLRLSSAKTLRDLAEGARKALASEAESAPVGPPADTSPHFERAAPLPGERGYRADLHG